MTSPSKLYLVRQYRPAFVTGFENAVVRAVPYDEITSVPWSENFKYPGFVKFTIDADLGDELIISAWYEDGKHWVVGFALPEDSIEEAPDGGLLRDNWRYKGQHS